MACTMSSKSGWKRYKMGTIGVASADWLRPHKNKGVAAWGGAGWARIGQYIPNWEKHHDIVVGTLWALNDGTMGIVTDHEDGETHLHQPDTIIMQRLMH